jgi:cytochrome oxidase Cu insertion factor (SCO1/SenC/PrrC family)
LTAAIALLLVALTVAAVAAVLGDDQGSGLAGGADLGPDDRFRGNAPAARFIASDFALRDASSGEFVRMADQRGRVVVLTFLESRCEAACPLIASQLAEAMRRLSSKVRAGVVALAVSSNPRDDTRKSVLAFLRRHRATGQIRYLHRPEAELRRVWREYQVLSALESGDADTHSAPVRIYSRTGRWLATQHAGVDLSVDNLVHDISLAVAG